MHLFVGAAIPGPPLHAYTPDLTQAGRIAFGGDW